MILAPLDVLWRRQEKFLLSRGLAPQRNALWERNVRAQGWALAGITIFLVALVLAARFFNPTPSGVTINGQMLTQAEWDGCNRDIQTCLYKVKACADDFRDARVLARRHI